MTHDAATSTATPTAIEPQEIGHVVLKVRDLRRSGAFYEMLGFRKVGEVPGMAFYTATGENHHDLGLLEVGPGAPAPPSNAVGLYHAAIRLPSDDHVRAAFRRLSDAGAAVTGTADHGVSHSLYIRDPDGIELELYADVEGADPDEIAVRPWDPR